MYILIITKIVVLILMFEHIPLDHARIVDHTPVMSVTSTYSQGEKVYNGFRRSHISKMS